LEFTRLLEILLDQHYINQCEDIGIILEFMQNKKNLEELCLNFDELLKIINVLTTITDGNPEVRLLSFLYCKFSSTYSDAFWIFTIYSMRTLHLTVWSSPKVAIGFLGL
jgi:hypothetical protein